jgi:predicted phosphodiesterase
MTEQNQSRILNFDFEENDQNVKQIQALINKYHISPEELQTILKQKGQSVPETGLVRKLPSNGKHTKFTVISDLHMGHNKYRPDILDHAIRNSNKQGSEFYCIPGDILEGMSGREGHIYELAHIGATNQLNYGIEQLSKLEKPVYAITATNSHDGWYSSKGNMGFEVGPELARRIKDFNFLGYDEADLELDNGITIRMTHPGDGTAYAVSYKAQKYLNALSGGTKPDINLQGHYHKAMYMFYRNVHHFDAGTLCDQTIFMKKVQTPAMTGYWIIDAWANKKGVDRIKSEFVPFWE